MSRGLNKDGTALDVLKCVRSLLMKYGWHRIGSKSKGMGTLSMFGAFALAGIRFGETDAYERLRERVKGSIHKWHDQPGRTKQDVLKVLSALIDDMTPKPTTTNGNIVTWAVEGDEKFKAIYEALWKSLVDRKAGVLPDGRCCFVKWEGLSFVTYVMGVKYDNVVLRETAQRIYDEINSKRDTEPRLIVAM